MASARADAGGGGRIWFAQALRAPACLMVVWAHVAVLLAGAVVVATPGMAQPPWIGFDHWIQGAKIDFGLLGVSIFFVVSGFVIPFSLQRGGPGTFALRRFFRLYPTLWFCLALTVVVVKLYNNRHGLPLGFDTHDIVSSAFLVSGYTGNKFVIGGLWTLAIEELFYVIAAVLAWRGLLRQPLALVATGAALTVAAVLTGDGLTPFDGSFWLRYWLARNTMFVVFILIGVALHWYYRRVWSLRTTAIVSTLLFAMFFVATQRSSTDPGRGYIENAALGLALFIAFLAADRRLPHSKPVDWTADISYPLYLIHGGVGGVALASVYARTENLTVSVLGGIGAAVASAVLAHYLVERPSMVLGRRAGAWLDARRGDRTGTVEPVALAAPPVEEPAPVVVPVPELVVEPGLAPTP